MKRLRQVDEVVSDLLSSVSGFFVSTFLIYNFCFCRFIMILLKKHILILLVLLVLCLMVWLKVFLYLGFMILPLLLHLEDLLLTSYLVFHFLVVVLLLALQIKRRLSVKFLMCMVLVLWIKGKMWCKQQILALADLANLDL